MFDFYNNAQTKVVHPPYNMILFYSKVTILYDVFTESVVGHHVPFNTYIFSSHDRKRYFFSFAYMDIY